MMLRLWHTQKAQGFLERVAPNDAEAHLICVFSHPTYDITCVFTHSIYDIIYVYSHTLLFSHPTFDIICVYSHTLYGTHRRRRASSRGWRLMMLRHLLLCLSG